MRNLLNTILSGRVFPLIIKELQQIMRNRRLVVSLIIPPTVMILLFGFALNPSVRGLRLGVVDESSTAESRELISAFTESGAFRAIGHYASSDALGREISMGKIDTGLVIPYDFAKRRQLRETAPVQLIFNGVDTNTAQIASGYAVQIINALNRKYAETSGGAIALRSAGSPLGRASISARIALFFNPGLETSWFIVTGILGTLLVLNGSVVSSATMINEKESGTLEQLLMTPAEPSEIIIAKVTPLLMLLTGEFLLSLVVGYLVFGVPIRGSFLLLLFSGVLCILAGIGIGTFLSSFCRTQQQAQLLSFFINPPISLLSGGTTPIEAMPKWLQPFTLFNPVRHFALIARGVMLKGTGLMILYPYFLALLSFTILLVSVSMWRFRKQLG